MTWTPSQTKNFKACPGYLVPIIKSLDTDIELEAKEECYILSVSSISFKGKVDERLRVILNRPPGDKREEMTKKKTSYLVNIRDFISARDRVTNSQ